MGRERELPGRKYRSQNRLECEVAGAHCFDALVLAGFAIWGREGGRKLASGQLLVG